MRIKRREETWEELMGWKGKDMWDMIVERQLEGGVRTWCTSGLGRRLYMSTSSSSERISIPSSLKIGPSPSKISRQGGTMTSAFKFALLVKVSVPCSERVVVSDSGQGQAFLFPCMMAPTPLTASRCCFRIPSDEINATYNRTQIITANNVSQCYSRWS